MAQHVLLNDVAPAPVVAQIWLKIKVHDTKILPECLKMFFSMMLLPALALAAHPPSLQVHKNLAQNFSPKSCQQIAFAFKMTFDVKRYGLWPQKSKFTFILFSSRVCMGSLLKAWTTWRWCTRWFYPQTWATPQNNEIENKFDHDLHPDDNAWTKWRMKFFGRCWRVAIPRRR